MMKYKHILPDGVAAVSFSKIDFHFFQQDKSRALRPSWFSGDGVRLLFFVWWTFGSNQLRIHSNLSFCLASAPVPSLPISECSPLPSSSWPFSLWLHPSRHFSLSLLPQISFQHSRALPQSTLPQIWIPSHSRVCLLSWAKPVFWEFFLSIFSIFRPLPPLVLLHTPYSHCSVSRLFSNQCFLHFQKRK